MNDQFEQLKIRPDKTHRKTIRNQIADTLEDYIVSHSLPGSLRLPDVKTLAAHSGVSLRTMDLALQRLVERGVCYRQAKKGTFVAGSLSGGRPGALRLCGLINQGTMPGDVAADAVTGPIYSGMEYECRRRSCDLLSITAGRLESYSDNPAVDLAGVLLLHWNDRGEIFSFARKFPGVKFIFANYDPGHLEDAPLNIGAAFNDEFAGGFELASAFLFRGHHRLALLNLQLPDNNYQLRRAGILEACGNFGMNSAQVRVFTPPGTHDWSIEQQLRLGGRLAAHAVRTLPGLSAILCVNDLLAAGAARFLMENKLHGRIEICGYDNVMKHLSRDLNFSTVDIDFRAIGVQAVHLLSRDFRRTGSRILRVAPRLLLRFQTENTR